MAGTCESCGNTYERAFEVIMHDGGRHTFDSFECAINMLAPECPACGTKVIGHGTERGQTVYCCQHCCQHCAEAAA